MRVLERIDAWWDANSPRRRLDSNFGNLFMLLGLMLPSLSIVIRGPVPSSVLAHMPEGLQVAMCACIFFGCAAKLHGALAGRRFWFPHTSIKRCYVYGYSGAPMASVGCITYGYYILSNTENFWSALSGIATPMFGVGISAQALIYALEYRRIDRNERHLRTLERAKDL